LTLATDSLADILASPAMISVIESFLAKYVGVAKVPRFETKGVAVVMVAGQFRVTLSAADGVTIEHPSRAQINALMPLLDAQIKPLIRMSQQQKLVMALRKVGLVTSDVRQGSARVVRATLRA